MHRHVVIGIRYGRAQPFELQRGELLAGHGLQFALEVNGVRVRLLTPISAIVVAPMRPPRVGHVAIRDARHALADGRAQSPG